MTRMAQSSNDATTDTYVNPALTRGELPPGDPKGTPSDHRNHQNRTRPPFPSMIRALQQAPSTHCKLTPLLL